MRVSRFPLSPAALCVAALIVTQAAYPETIKLTSGNEITGKTVEDRGIEHLKILVVET